MAIRVTHIPVPSTYHYDPRIITRSISAGLSIINKDMRIVWANKHLQEWFGSLYKIKGKHCYEIYQHRERVCPGCPTAKVFKYACAHCTSIQKGILANNSARYFKLTTSPIKNNNDKIVQVLELVEDVTEQRKWNREVKRKLNILTKEIDFISKLDKEFISSQELSLDKILQQSVEIAKSLVGAKICNLRLVDGTQKTLISRASLGLSKSYTKRVVMKVGEGIAGKVAASKHPLIVDDIQSCKYTKFNGYVKRERLHSAICIPILLKDESLGTLTVYDRKRRTFTKEDCNLLLCFANHIAILLDNVKTHKEIHQSYLNTIKSLVTAIEARDPYTRGHSEKVTKFALDIADAIGLSREDKLTLVYCGRLHDIGKIGISDSILNKPGPLTITERAEVQLHPVKAVEMLTNLKFLEKGIPIIRHHHERYDGKGYPDGLKGKDIPLLARILGCADAFDAMTSDRAYRRRMTLDVALKELKRNRGRQFDPEILDAFVGTLSKS